MEIIELQEKFVLNMYKNVMTEQFWAIHVSDEYSNCKILAIITITIFSSTYMCETLFSKMNLKSKY